MTDTSASQDASSPSSQDAADRPDFGGDRFDLIEELGTGGVGTVFRGRQTRLDREVAIKEIRNVFDVFADVQREDIVRRFSEITREQAALSHPNVVQIYDIDTGADYPYVVTEYAPAGNLRRLIDSEQRTLRVALKYFIQLLHGLNAAHDAGLVHGNIKPENVVLDASGNAKLSDFGLSTLVDLGGGAASNQVYVGVGAVAYMSPEQFQNPQAATIKSDIYSLGIMFYEMLTGKVPGRRSPMPSSFYPEIPRKLDDIFDQMSMDSPEDRYNSIDDVLADFYGADEITELLDKQSGVVFFRDPIAHGDAVFTEEGSENAAGHQDGPGVVIAEDTPADDSPLRADTSFEAESASEGPVAEFTDADDSLEVPGPADDGERRADEHVEELQADPVAAEAQQVDGGQDQTAGDGGNGGNGGNSGDENDGGDDVLDKLDQYGALFDEED